MRVRDIRRGRDLDSLELTSVDGDVLHVVAYGLTADERRRARETLLTWLVRSGIPLADDGGRLR